MTSKHLTMELPPMTLAVADGPQQLGTRVLAGVLNLAQATLTEMQRIGQVAGQTRLAAVSRLRGTGRGVHFSDMVTALEQAHPVQLVSPFEDSHLVAGAAWEGPSLIGPGCTAALAKLRWSAGADDLPMHVHDHSDRFIIVDKGRGYFHVSDQPFDQFDGRVRTIPARERDVFVFTRGVVHTFSTADQPMTLLSCQLPFLPFDDPHQFRIPRMRWVARENPERVPATVQVAPSWMLLFNTTGC
ncbi:MAG TPA: hypothetical protein VFF65_08170 [Phycisphaerales bacterium]|nr:hypothetical protein [Phycisphaerales bacterium]